MFMRFVCASSMCLCVVSAAAQSPFVEDFEGGLAGWGAGGGLDPAVLGTEGGNSFASVTAPVTAAVPGAPFNSFTALAGNLDNGASGGAFAGNYPASGITGLSFDVRHNAGQDLTFTLRVATPANNPGFIVFNPTVVAAGSEFTTLSYSFDLSNPLIFPLLDPAAVLPNVGNIQLLVDRPVVGEVGEVMFDFDNVAIVPAPATGALLGGLGLTGLRRRRS
ncbi:MAG: hypothetical protein AAF108_09490 [Planctomycetota bacterium]